MYLFQYLLGKRLSSFNLSITFSAQSLVIATLSYNLGLCPIKKDTNNLLLGVIFGIDKTYINSINQRIWSSKTKVTQTYECGDLT